MEIIQSPHLIEEQIKAKPEDKRELFKIIFSCGEDYDKDSKNINVSCLYKRGKVSLLHKCEAACSQYLVPNG